MRYRGLASLLLVSALGCVAPAGPKTVQDLDARLRSQHARLEQITVQISEGERRAADAKAEADFQECRAVQASIAANATVTVATCQEEIAKHSECDAKNSAHVAKSGIAGCIFGILAAGATGGAAAPVALSGCAAGGLFGSATKSTCQAVTCSIDPSEAIAAALRAHGMKAAPACGGVIGAVLEESDGRVKVRQVQADGAAAAAGILPGDEIRSIDGAQVTIASDVVRMLGRRRPGSLFHMDLERAGRALEISVATRPHPVEHL